MTYSIGELAELTGLSVKTIRFYSDRGVVPPSDRTTRGYRRYDASALARLELVRTLRDLGLDLATIQRVLTSEVPLADVLATHASALDTQLRVLRTRRAVVRAAVDRTPADLESLHRLARLTDSERQSLTNNFLTAVFNETAPTNHGGERSGSLSADRMGESGGPAANGGGASGVSPTLAAVRRTMNPELPDDPTSEQLDAWLELATLSQDPEFRDLLHQLALAQVAAQPDQAPPRPDPIAILRDQLAPALAAGLDPTSGEAAHLIQALNHQPTGDLDIGHLDPAHLERAADPRRDRYLELLAVINGWPRPSASAPAVQWFLAARQAAAAR